MEWKWPKARLLEYAWSSLVWYLATPQHRPRWMLVDRLLGEYAIAKDAAAGRELFERRMERRRVEEIDRSQWKPLEGGLNSEPFRARLLARIESQFGPHHSVHLRLEPAAAKAERIVAEELKRLGWKEVHLATLPKGDPEKLTIAARLRRQTTLTVAAIAQRLHCGSCMSLRNKVYLRSKA